MENKKSIAGIAALIVVLATAVAGRSGNIGNVSRADSCEAAPPCQTAQIDHVTVLSLEGVIGQLPGISQNDLDVMTAGSCGIEIPYDLANELS